MRLVEAGLLEPKGYVLKDLMPITVRTRRVLHAIFTTVMWERVEKALMTDCGPAQVHARDEAMERIWLAALKLSRGNIVAFEDAVLLAQIDWRDLLMGAGFGNESEAHLEWAALITG